MYAYKNTEKLQEVCACINRINRSRVGVENPLMSDLYDNSGPGKNQ